MHVHEETVCSVHVGGAINGAACNLKAVLTNQHTYGGLLRRESASSRQPVCEHMIVRIYYMIRYTYIVIFIWHM